MLINKEGRVYIDSKAAKIPDFFYKKCLINLVQAALDLPETSHYSRGPCIQLQLKKVTRRI